MTKIAAIQTTSGCDVDCNLVMVDGYVDAAASGGAEVVFLPECFALMASSSARLRAAAEEFGGGVIQDFMRDLARRFKVWIVAGSLPLVSEDSARVFNSLLVYDALGNCVARYDKIHLFDVELADEAHRESDYTAPGSRCVVAQTPAGTVGLSVCYDLRFPEIYRRLVAAGAECLVVPSAFTVPTGAAHWLPLLRARAIENSCYVIAPAQVGAHQNGRVTYGHSTVIDPWGEVIALRETEPGVLFAEVDSGKLAKVRKQLPSHKHRRDDLFL